MSQVGGTATGNPDEEVAPTVIDAYYSLLAEGGQLKGLPEEKRHFTKVELDEALRILAEDDSKTISPAARYHALEQLAQPLEGEGSRRSAASLATAVPRQRRIRRYQRVRGDLRRRGKEDDLVDHIHETEGVVYPTGELLSYAARVVLDPSRICSSDLVTAHTNAGRSSGHLCLFSQFDSTAGFEVLVGWLDPTTWPPRPAAVQVGEGRGPAGADHGAGEGGKGLARHVPREGGADRPPTQDLPRLLVLVPRRLAALTYDLHESVGGELTVDRGYLSITPNPDGRGYGCARSSWCRSRTATRPSTRTSCAPSGRTASNRRPRARSTPAGGQGAASVRGRSRGRWIPKSSGGAGQSA